MKIIIICAILVLSFSGSCLAGKLATGSVTPSPGLSIYGGDSDAAAANAVNPMVKLSSGVNGFANYDTTGYAIFTKHVKGTKIFGTPHDSTKMYYKQVLASDALSSTNCGSVSGDAAFASGWTSY